MFTGLYAFPLTPFHNEKIDFAAFEKLILNLVEAKVDGICAMGSTGLYPYLDCTERKHVIEHCVSRANGIPVISGIGALRTNDVLKHAEIAQQAGVDSVLLAPVSYHPLSEDEVYSLYEKVSKNLSIPLCVYENPGTTQFTFSEQLYAAITHLPNIGAIKIPGMPFGGEQGTTRLTRLRQLVPPSVAIGVSGDKYGAAGMAAGCDLWLSVVGGLFPKTIQAMIASIDTGNPQIALAKTHQLEPLWELFIANKGGMRVMASAAEILGYCEFQCLPAPLKSLNSEHTVKLETLLKQWKLT